MVVDFHTHIYPPAFRERREEYLKQDITFASLFSNSKAKLATAEELVAAMDEARVDVAVALGIGWTDKEVAKEANDYIIEATRKFPGRLLSFCSINPGWGEDALIEVERRAKEGVKGIGELHPDTQGFDITNKETMAPIMELARRLGLIVLTHASEPVGHLYPGKGKTTPHKLYTFIQNFPENIIVCAHWGGGLPFYALLPEVARTLTNVHFDTAASPLLYRPEVFPRVVDLIGSNKVLFGTDFPLVTHRRLIKQIEDAPMTLEDREDILGRNARRLLGL